MVNEFTSSAGKTKQLAALGQACLPSLVLCVLPVLFIPHLAAHPSKPAGDVPVLWAKTTNKQGLGAGLC